MNTRILFLGTGGDEFVIGKQKRSSGGIIFTYGPNQFHFDPGPSSLTPGNRALVVSGGNVSGAVSKSKRIPAFDSVARRPKDIQAVKAT